MSDLATLIEMRDDENLGWLDQAACWDMDLSDFFVEAGHVIAQSTLNRCRGCPVREECVRHSYDFDEAGGYFGGLSPGQRRDMSLDEALVFIQNDPPR